MRIPLEDVQSEGPARHAAEVLDALLVADGGIPDLRAECSDFF